jgi:hypothetical protein
LLFFWRVLYNAPKVKTHEVFNLGFEDGVFKGLLGLGVRYATRISTELIMLALLNNHRAAAVRCGVAAALWFLFSSLII